MMRTSATVIRIIAQAALLYGVAEESRWCLFFSIFILMVMSELHDWTTGIIFRELVRLKER